MKQFLYILFILILSFSTYGQGLNPSLIAVSIGEGTPTPPTPPVDDDLFPVLSNFYVDDTKMYFDSSEPITASSTTGFEITGKTISGITIITGATTGHYFTVSSAFNFWENNTIRYEGGSNLQDAESNALHDFTLQYITNNIAEPDASTDRYVTVAGAGSHNGTVGNEWTFEEAGTNAVAGQTVWVKAGNYGNINVTIENTGSVSSPIKFIGYKSSIGDSPSLTREIDLAFDSAEMPLLVGNGTGNGLYSYMEDYIIIKNIQIENYDADMYLRNATGLWFDNVYVKDATHCLKIVFDPSKDIRVTNSYIADATAMGIWAYGSHWLIDNTWAVSSRVVNMDYHITFNAGSNVNGYNIVRNSYTHSYYDDTHGDHAISIKGEPTKLSEYTLVENCVIENSGMGIEFRHENSKRNVARNNYGTRTAAKQSASDTAGSLITFRDGATHNTVENCTMEELSHAIWFNDNYNEEGQQAGGHYNKVINSVFINNVSDISIDDGISYPAVTYALEPTNNEFLNNTFYNSSNLITNNNVAFGSTNLIKNSIIESIPSYDGSPSFSYSNFNGGFTKPTGTGNTSVVPYLDYGDYALTSQTTSAVYEGGTDVSVYYDINGRERQTTFSQGAYQIYGTDVFPDYFANAEYGNDTNNGSTELLAVKTLAQIETDATGFVAGHRIGLKGEFYGNLTLNNVDGTSGNEITLTSYTNSPEKAIITGGEEITGWTNTSGNIWEADVTGKTIYQVTKDNTSLRLASYPKTTDFGTTTNTYDVDSSADDSHFISSSLIGFPNIVGGTAHVMVHNTRYRAREITAFNSTTGEVTLASDAGNLNANSWFFVTNDYDLLDAVDEWYYDSTANKLYVYSVGSPVDIYATTYSGDGINITNSDYLDVTNLQVKGYTLNGINLSGSSNNIIDSNVIYYAQRAGIASETGDNIDVTNNYIKGSVREGVGLRTTNSLVDNNTIYEIGLVKDFTDVESYTMRGITLDTQTDGCTVSNNHIEKVGLIGIRDYGENNTIEKNFILDWTLSLHDAGAINTWNSSQAGTAGNGLVIDKNIMLSDNIPPSASWYTYGIYLDDNSHNITVTNNSMTGGRSGMFFHNTFDITARYNTSYMSRLQGLALVEDGTGAGDDTVINNTIEYNNFLIDYLYTGVAKYKSIYSLPYSYGTSNYNAYYNLTTNNVIRREYPSYAQNIPLSDWQSAVSQDANSTSSFDSDPITATDFIYNETSQEVEKTLVGTWSDLRNNQYVGTITLQPYTSHILIQPPLPVPEFVDPNLLSVQIPDLNPDNVVMTFDEPVTGTNLGFTLSGTTSTTFASITGGSTVWTGILGTNAANGETITLSYSSTTGDFTDLFDNALASITNQSVTNNVGSVSFGPERVTDGDMSVPASWTTLSGVTITGGVMQLNTTLIYASVAYQNTTMDVGKTYRLSFDISGYVSGELGIQQGNENANSIIKVTADDNYAIDFNGAGETRLNIRTSGGTTQLDIDNISIKEIL